VSSDSMQESGVK